MLNVHLYVCVHICKIVYCKIDDHRLATSGVTVDNTVLEIYESVSAQSDKYYTALTSTVPQFLPFSVLKGCLQTSRNLAWNSFNWHTVQKRKFKLFSMDHFPCWLKCFVTCCWATLTIHEFYNILLTPPSLTISKYFSNSLTAEEYKACMEACHR